MFGRAFLCCNNEHRGIELPLKSRTDLTGDQRDWTVDSAHLRGNRDSQNLRTKSTWTWSAPVSPHRGRSLSYSLLDVKLHGTEWTDVLQASTSGWMTSGLMMKWLSPKQEFCCVYWSQLLRRHSAPTSTHSQRCTLKEHGTCLQRLLTGETLMRPALTSRSDLLQKHNQLRKSLFSSSWRANQSDASVLSMIWILMCQFTSRCVTWQRNVFYFGGSSQTQHLTASSHYGGHKQLLRWRHQLTYDPSFSVKLLSSTLVWVANPWRSADLWSRSAGWRSTQTVQNRQQDTANHGCPSPSGCWCWTWGRWVQRDLSWVQHTYWTLLLIPQMLVPSTCGTI